MMKIKTSEKPIDQDWINFAGEICVIWHYFSYRAGILYKITVFICKKTIFNNAFNYFGIW